MIGRRARRLLAGVILLTALGGPAAAEPPVVTSVEITVDAPLRDEAQVRAAIGDLAGKPLSRDAVRASVDRLWTLQRFSTIRVREIAAAGGLALRYELTLRAPIRRIAWEGEPGIDLAVAVAAAGLAIGEEASPERLARAERDLLTRYRADGYLAARARFQTEAVPGTGERDVTVFLDAGGPTKMGTVRLVGDTGLPTAQIDKALKLEEGERYRESRMRDGVRAAEERLRGEGYYGARVTARPEWRPEANRVDLEIAVTAGPRYQIKFAGRSALSESALKARLTFPETGSAEAHEQEASAHQLEAAYRERGYHFVTVKTRETRDGDVRVIHFAIDEGPRVIVESVTFPGDHAVSADELAERIETKPPGLFRRGLFRLDTLERDVGVLLAYLRSLGYVEAAAGPPQVHFSDDRTRARVEIPVRDGPRITTGAITVEGAQVVTRAQIDAALPFRDRMVALTTLLQRRFTEIFGLMRAVGMVAPPKHRHRAEEHAVWRRQADDLMVGLSGDDAARLSIPPAEFVHALRLLTFSASHEEIADGRLLTPERIVSVVLDGCLARSTQEDPRC